METKLIVLKELYVSTFKELISAPVYKLVKSDIAQDIERNIKLSIAEKEDLSEFAVEGNHLQGFKEKYGHVFSDNIKNTAIKKRDSNTTKLDEESKAFENEVKARTHEEIYNYLYLRNRLRVIEQALHPHLKPIIEVDGSVSFVEIKK
jgi:hypothetical protein